MQRFARLDRLALVAYLALAGVTAAGLWQIDRILLRWLALGLVVGFGLLQSRLPAYGEGSQLSENWPPSPNSRRRANLIIAAQAALVAALIEITGAGFPLIFLFFILSVTVMLYNLLRWGLLWLAGFTLFTGWFFFVQEGLGGGLRAMAIYASGYLFFGVVTNALTQAWLAQRRNVLLLGKLQAKNRQLEAYAAQVETLAAIEERNRLAREVHDTIGHRLTAAAIQLEGAERLAAHDPERSAALIGAGRQQVREALQDLRRTVGRLREPVEIELPLLQALRRLAAGFEEATGLLVHLELPETACEMTSAQRLALYRTAQEGLTNILRHAAARQAWLRLECSPDQIALHVSDDGRGLAADAGLSNGRPNSGFGLRGLRERAAQLNGVVTLADRPGGGATLTIQLPTQKGLRHGTDPHPDR
ncbi:MAG: sensor histidine kinase [Anaerolineae bacterium]